MAQPASPFDVLFIGAGNITFGNDNVLWNHSDRIEKLLGARLRVCGIVDPSVERVNQVLAQKRASASSLCYAQATHYNTVKAAADDLKQKNLLPRLIVLGTPPYFRGTENPSRDLELQIIVHFGSSPAIFCEKPVSTARPHESYPVALALRKSQNIVSVGYMLRYLKVVQQAKSIIDKHNITVMSVGARYTCAYSRIRKVDWWDKSKQCGPIVEQATHFADLCRFFGGEVLLDSVQALALEPYENAGKLSNMAIDETQIPESERIPRATTAMWKYSSGALGTLTHIIALHGIRYSNEIVISGDGYQLRLTDLYTIPTLHVRTPEAEQEKSYTYANDDPFQSEFAGLLHSIGEKTETTIGSQAQEESDVDHLIDSVGNLSTYEDACKTYEFTWRIRDESESTSSRSRQK